MSTAVDDLHLRLTATQMALEFVRPATKTNVLEMLAIAKAIYAYLKQGT